jgi:hypothetical protein
MGVDAGHGDKQKSHSVTSVRGRAKQSNLTETVKSKIVKTARKKPTRFDLSAPNKSKSAKKSSTQRVQEYRARDAKGMRCYSLTLPSAALELMLTDANLLASLKADDHAATTIALQKMVMAALAEYLPVTVTS